MKFHRTVRAQRPTRRQAVGGGRPLALAIFMLSSLSGAGFGADGRNDLVPLVRTSGAQGLCYRRRYDTEHLRRHPGQTISSATVLLKPAEGTDKDAEAPDALDLSARFTLRTGSEPLYGMASCWWERGGNRLDGGVRAEPRIKSDDGTRCMAMVEPNSAEEAGDFLLDLSPSGGDLIFYNGFSQMRAGPKGARAMRDVNFGPSDEVIRLKRVGRALCEDIEAVLAEPVRVQNR